MGKESGRFYSFCQGGLIEWTVASVHLNGSFRYKPDIVHMRNKKNIELFGFTDQAVQPNMMNVPFFGFLIDVDSSDSIYSYILFKNTYAITTP